MERSIATDVTQSTSIGLSTPISLGRRLFPLWRHAAFLAALFAVAGAGAMVRLQVQQLRKDLSNTTDALLEERVLQDRLVLETETRTRALVLEGHAQALGLSDQAELVVLRAR